MTKIPLALPISPLGVWANRVNQKFSEQDNAIDKDSLDSKTQPFQFSYQGFYNSDSFYGVWSLVFVKATTVVNTKVIPAGMWLCVQMVPSNEFTTVQNVEQYGAEYKRDTAKNYFPTWPLPTNEEDIYWVPFGSFVTMGFCDDNNKVRQYYVSAFTSGSVG